MTANTKPAWQQVNDLFARYGLALPPTSLRDALVVAEWNTRAALSPLPSATEGWRDERLGWFMTIMAQVKQTDASDCRWNWIMAFCSDRGNDNDTFNIAADRHLIAVSHNSDTDHSECWITPEGEAYVAALSPLPAAPVSAEEADG